MSPRQTTGGIVTDTIKDLLPTVNAGFNWDIVRKRYDRNPEGTAMSLHFTDDSGDEPVEEVLLGIADDPKLVVLDQYTDDWDYLGAIVMYQKHGIRILDPDDPMNADAARYQHGSVTIRPGEDKSRERTWMAVSKILDIMLESVIHSDGDDDQGGGDA